MLIKNRLKVWDNPKSLPCKDVSANAITVWKRNFVKSKKSEYRLKSELWTQIALRCKNILFWYTHFKNLPTVGGDSPLPHPPQLGHFAPRWQPLPHPPHVGHFAPSLCPPLTNPGYTTASGVAKGVQGPRPPPPPLIGESNKSFDVPQKTIWIHII